MNTGWREAQWTLAKLETAPRRASMRRLAGVSILIFAVGCFVAASLFLAVNLNQLRASFVWLEHTDQVLLQIATVENSLLEAKSMAPALARDAVFRDKERLARDTIAQRMDGLDRLVADNPEQTRRAAELRGLIASRLTLLDRFPAWALPGQRVIVSAAHSEERRQLMSAIYASLTGLRAAELPLLAERQRDADRAAGLSLFLAISIALAALVSGVMGVSLIWRERNESRVRELKIQLMHMQRLNAMGPTTSALVHEINQPLTAAANYLSALRILARKGGAGSERKIADVAKSASDQIVRAGLIISRLRSFIDKRDNERRIESPAMLIGDAIALIGKLDKTVTFKTGIEEGLSDVLIDRIQLQQVLVNLLRNALEACAGREHPELLLTAIAHGPDEVRICLQDNGPGLPAEVSDHLFKHFISTKPDGMGVGLSICQAIVASHGGRIWAQPNPTGGTQFCFTLPALHRERKLLPPPPRNSRQL